MPTRSNCIQLESVRSVVESALKQSKAPKGVLERVMDAVAATTLVYGHVDSVETYSGKRTIFVKGMAISSEFDFPPNGADFENELIRGQNAGLEVMVAYQVDTKGEKTIIEVRVLANPTN
jgi:hypothetical protein